VHGIGSVMDLYPTVLSLAGAEVPDVVVDSIDLSPSFVGQESPRDSFAYYRRGELFAFRKGPYKIHFITQGAYGLPPARTVHEQPLLYHLGEDPGEKFDIADREPDVLAELMAAADLQRAGMQVAESIFEIGR